MSASLGMFGLTFTENRRCTRSSPTQSGPSVFFPGQPCGIVREGRPLPTSRYFSARHDSPPAHSHGGCRIRHWGHTEAEKRMVHANLAASPRTPRMAFFGVQDTSMSVPNSSPAFRLPFCRRRTQRATFSPPVQRGVPSYFFPSPVTGLCNSGVPRLILFYFFPFPSELFHSSFSPVSLSPRCTATYFSYKGGNHTVTSSSFSLSLSLSLPTEVSVVYVKCI